MRRILALLPLLWPLVAAASDPPLLLTYQGTLAGAPVIHAEARLDRDATRYTLRTSVQTVGALSVLVRGHSDVISQGVWRGNGAVPSHTDSEGFWNGRPRRLVIDYAGGVPDIRVMEPDDPERRRALSRDDIAGTTDTLGLMVGLIRQVAATGRCDIDTRLFDGHGVTAFSMTTSARTAQPAALRCDFSTRKVAGLRPNDDPRRVDHGYALFAAPSPGLPVLPVRIVFHTRWTGDAVLALVDAHTLS